MAIGVKISTRVFGQNFPNLAIVGTIYILGRVAAAARKVMRPESALIIRTEMRKIKSQIARVPEPYSRLEKWLMNPLINSAYCFRGLQQYTIYHCVALY